MNILDQNVLRELEAKCVQEQPPAAMAACPLHVNCRELCAAVSVGDFDAARVSFTRAAAFPDILSRICRAPCSAACVRKDLGGAVDMRGLERAAMLFGKPKPRRMLPIPKKSGSVAVVGAGVCGLTAALELAKKGCIVTVFEKSGKIGGGLLQAGLPQGVIDEELKAFKPYAVTFSLNSTISEPRALLDEYDAALISWGGNLPEADSRTLQTGTPGLFSAGGFDSAVFSMDAGKRAAISIDRFLKKVSLTAGRESEGCFETSLYVETGGIDSKPPSTESGGTREAAISEAGRCLDCKCLECAKGCAFISHFKRYPRKYVREVYNNLSIAMGNRTSNTLINSCALCSQCAVICPNGLDLGEVMMSARKIMVETEKMPRSAFAFAVDDMRYSNSGTAFLSRNQPGFSKSKYLFFPGCQLGASSPAVISKAYRHLTSSLEGGVGILLGCCGIVARWAGRERLFLETQEMLRGEWAGMGKPMIITACPTCQKTLAKDFGEVRDICSVLLDIGLPPGYKGGESYMIHDACGARDETEARESVRRLLDRMGCRISEPEYTGDKSPCCGYGGLVQFSNSQVAGEMTALCTKEVDITRMTYCMNCRDRFTKSGARAVHILELIYDGKSAAGRDAPGYSLRQDNREGLKRAMLAEFWNEKQPEPKRIPLTYTKELAALLEKRLILERDIREVISNAIETGSFIREGNSGVMIANKRIGHVTFWVSFTPEGDGWQVLKAYSHRMEIR